MAAGAAHMVSMMNHREQQIADRIVQLRAFLDEHGHLPQRRAADEQEKRLSDWAYRHMRARNPWPEAVELIEGAGGYRQIGYRSGFEDRLLALQQFTDTHGRLPSTDESALGRWTYNHVNRARNVDSRVLALVRTYGGYKSRPGNSRLVDRTDDLRSFIAQHERMPTANGDLYESNLFSWVGLHRRTGKLPEAALRLAEQYGDTPHTTRRRIAELESFVETHGRMPRTTGDAVERSLFGWLLDYRKNDAVDPRVLGIVEFYTRRGAHLKAQQLVSDLGEFVAVYNRFPRNDGPVPDEHQLYHRAYSHAKKQHPHPAVLRMVREHGVKWSSLQDDQVEEHAG